MNIAICLLVSVLCLYHLFKNNIQKLITVLSLGLILIPTLKLGTLHIGFKYLIFPIIILYFLKNLKLPKYNSKELLYILTFFLLTVFSLLGGAINNPNLNSLILPLIGSIVNFAILFFYISIIHTKKIDFDSTLFKIAKYIIIFNAVAVLIQVVFPRETIQLFYSFYRSDQVNVYDKIFNFIHVHGYYYRFFGLFNSPVTFGIIALLSWVTLFHRYLYAKDNKIIKYLILTILVGFSSLSKTFLIGLPLFSFLIIFFHNIILKFTAQKLINSFVIFIVITTSLILIIKIGSYFSNYIEYYSNFIWHPLEALKSRYSIDEEIALSDTYEMIRNHFIIGVGPGSLQGELVGDSEYVKQLHNAGFIGLSCFLFFILTMMYLLFRKKEWENFFLFLIFIIGSLGLPIVFGTVYCIPFLTKILSYEKNRQL